MQVCTDDTARLFTGFCVPWQRRGQPQQQRQQQRQAAHQQKRKPLNEFDFGFEDQECDIQIEFQALQQGRDRSTLIW